MIKYRVPATSANLGIGFDTLGLALNIYNYFEIEKSEYFVFEGFMKTDITSNMFYDAYKRTCEYFNSDILPLHVSLNAEIPISRGLGSSSALIVGGIYAYYLLNNKKIDNEEIQKIATEIEGHPDNVTPCIYGNLCAVNNEVISEFSVSDKWNFYVLIPPYEVSTAEARKVIKREVSLKDAVNNISSALIGIDGLINFDEKKIKLLNNDSLHEPYRKTLIKDYETCKEEAYKNGAKAFLISGSGSTMLVISDKELKIDVKDIIFKKVEVDKEGAKCLENY